MWTFLGENWEPIIGMGGLLVAILSVAVNAGLFVRHKRDVRELLYIEQERDDFRKKFVQAEVRLGYVDPERFIDQVTEAYGKADFARVEELSLAFAERQSEAFGKAAEYLSEQRILDSENQDQAVINEARRFAAIGRAAYPGSKRLEELEALAQRRAEDIARGDPIEALNMAGMTDVELNRLSMAMQEKGHYALAEVAARRSVPLAALRTGAVSSNYAAALGNHGWSLHLLGAYDEAESIVRAALEIDKATIGAAHPDYAKGLNNLAGVVRAQGRHAEAEGLFREALEIGKATIGTAHPYYATRLNNLALVVQAQGRYAEAEGLFREALEIDKATIGAAHPEYATRLNNLAAVVEAQGRYAEAEGLLRETLEIGKATIGAAHPDYAKGLSNLAGVLVELGRREEAGPLFEEALATLTERLGPDHPDTAQAVRILDAFRAGD